MIIKFDRQTSDSCSTRFNLTICPTKLQNTYFILSDISSTADIMVQGRGTRSECSKSLHSVVCRCAGGRDNQEVVQWIKVIQIVRYLLCGWCNKMESDHWRGGNGSAVILDGVITKGLYEKVTFKLRIERRQRWEDQGESGPGREKSKYKVPAMERTCSRRGKKAKKAGAE